MEICSDFPPRQNTHEYISSWGCTLESKLRAITRTACFHWDHLKGFLHPRCNSSKSRSILGKGDGAACAEGSLEASKLCLTLTYAPEDWLALSDAMK